MTARRFLTGDEKGQTGRLADVDHSERNEFQCIIHYRFLFLILYGGVLVFLLFFFAVAEEAARDWKVRLVRWEWDLGLGPGPVLMCECSVDALQAGSFGTLHAVHHTLKHDFQPGFYWVFFF